MICLWMIRSRDFANILVRQKLVDNFQPKGVHQIYGLEQHWQIFRRIGIIMMVQT